MAFPLAAVLRALKKAKVKRLITPRKLGLPKIPKGKLSTYIRRGITQAAAHEYSSTGHILKTAARLVTKEPSITAQELLYLSDRAEMARQAADAVQSGLPGRAVGYIPAIPATIEQNYIGLQGGKFAWPTEIEFWNPEIGGIDRVKHTFVTIDIPDTHEFQRLVREFIDMLGTYPEFEEHYAEGDYDFDYQIVGVEQQT